MGVQGSLHTGMLNAMKAEQYVESLRFTLERLERNGDFSSPWIAEFRNTLVQRICELEESVHENVLVSGKLITNSGVLGDCIVRAIKLTIPKLNLVEYVKADVALTSPHLPNGDYELHFDGRVMKVKNTAGQWSFDDLRASGNALS
jgi:hypothetical protein